MSIENELKLIPQNDVNIEEILKTLTDKGYEIQGNPKIAKQEDTYYDDKKRSLYNTERSLRIRRTEKGVFVTYKIPISSETTYKQRSEYEEKIPEEYIKADGTVSIEDAVNVLKNKYPELELSENLQFATKVNNTRQKVNIKAEDGSMIELAFDDLNIEDQYKNSFKMNNEIEFEVLSGNADNLDNIYGMLSREYDFKRNMLSKYARSISEMSEQKDNMSLEEVTLCAMLSDIIKSTEFEQLKHKTQILGDYRIEMADNLNLDNFKDSQYLVNRISAMKRMENYRPKKIENLEEMFLCFFSDMAYRDIEYKLIKFLNENYYNDNKAITNRMSHSQQVMLITGLISISKEISEPERKPLLCMVSGLIHDIGHVPGAHPTESVLYGIDGFFSHETNGRDVIERIITEDGEQILSDVKKYNDSIGENYTDDQIINMIQEIKSQLKKAIEAHSRTNSESRGDGTVVQLPREADKICYGISDIVDIIKDSNNIGETLPVGFFSEEWRRNTIKRLGKGYDAKEEIIKKKIEEFDKLIRTNNFGELTTTISNTVRENLNDGRVYYDVEQDTWDILNSMIEYVKNFRITGRIDRKKIQFQKAAALLIVKKFNETLLECQGNIDNAWEETLKKITRCNDLDLLNTIAEIKVRFENDQEGWKNASKTGGILDVTNLKKLDNADRQIKIQPQGLFQLSDMLPYFGETYKTYKPEKLRDTYFDSDNSLSVCLREYIGRQKKELIVKRKREKRSNTG